MTSGRSLLLYVAGFSLAISLASGALAQTGAARGRGGGPSGGGPASAGSRGGATAPGGFPGARGRGGAFIDAVPADVTALYDGLDERALASAPPRDIKFVTAEEPKRTKLFRADPKLLQNKYVAEFDVMPAMVDPADTESIRELESRREIESEGIRFEGGTGRTSDRFHGDLVSLVAWEGDRLFYRGQFSQGRGDILDGFHKLLVAHCPTDQLPPPAIVAFLTSTECNRDVRRQAQPIVRRNVSYQNASSWHYTVFATSADEAKERAAGILRLLDGGMSRPVQRNLLKQGRDYLAEAKDTERQIAEKNEAIRVEQERLSKPSEITPDILSQLKAQKVMVAVELAGLIARVKACDEMLKDPKKLEISTLQSISDMKVKAEIERVGIKEKLDQINSFIGEGDGREAARSRLDGAQANKLVLQRSLSLQTSYARNFALLVELYAPLQLEANQVTVSPVEWTN